MSAGWPCPIWPGRLSIASYVSRRQPDCLVRCQPFDRVLHTVQEDSNKEELRFSPSSRCQRNGARERVQSRTPQRGYDLRSHFMEYTDYRCSARRRRRCRTGPPHHDQAPRDDAAPGPSNGSSQLAPATSSLINGLDDGAECTLSKLADDTRLEGVALRPGRRAAILRHLGRLERWADRDLMQFSKGKCKGCCV